ncbi:DNA-binding transcriptional regulator, MarR family [Epibacterium ulvae]|uniref:DNA-binding transcriptional regulator, MarR family n=2 Tax=Epibacterium ulvae TaxID=1156985 RepID=A0A1G5R1Y5_9RHOB|nr:MarR family transcriptional regulator [Epibacterium ulvae]SCZ67820.1 DNA-binding transcriptional regulator, MarR family [Epibacterium ulvae]
MTTCRGFCIPDLKTQFWTDFDQLPNLHIHIVKVRMRPLAIAMKIPIYNLSDAIETQQWMQHFIAKGLINYEHMMSQGVYSFCDEVTIADICLMPQFYNAKRWGIDLASSPKIRETVARPEKLSAFQQHPRVKPRTEHAKTRDPPMTRNESYKLDDFLPYLLNQAADALSLTFQKHYRDTYGMLRTEWRVLFHLGSFGDLTAKEICERSNIHKTKVSRAVTALETKGYLARQTLENDRRHSVITLTPKGREVFEDLRSRAIHFDRELKQGMTEEEYQTLLKLLGHFLTFHKK